MSITSFLEQIAFETIKMINYVIVAVLLVILSIMLGTLISQLALQFLNLKIPFSDATSYIIQTLLAVAIGSIPLKDKPS